MNGKQVDVLSWLDEEIAEARARLAAQLDRTNALVDFRSLALAIANREEAVALTADALFSAVVDEEEGAALRSLANRFTVPKEDPQ